MTDPLTPDDLARFRKEAFRLERPHREDDGDCVECGDTFPCPIFRLAARVRQLLDEVERLRKVVD